MQTENPAIISRIGRRIHLSITVAVALSILLIVVSIWNAQRTADTAEGDIGDSIRAQELSNALRTHQDAMNNAVEYAISHNEAQWRNTYESSLSSLQEALHTASLNIEGAIIEKIRRKLASVVVSEREIFRLIEENNSSEAFMLLASDRYQEQKIEQEELAFELRAGLDKQAKSAVQGLNSRLKHLIIALGLQLLMIALIWNYVVRALRQWQKSQFRHSEDLTRLAHYDTLTGIGNRALFHIRLEIAFKQSQRSRKPVALLLMDIDHFKDINDTLGHDVGDELLIHVAQELQRCCRETDTVVRLGGDEFAIIVCGLDEKRDTAILGQKILGIFKEPITVKENAIQTGTSIGFAFYPDDAATSEELLRKADMALYEAKRNGRGQFQHFDRRIEKQARRKLEIQEDLRSAIENEELLLFYQPIVDLATEEVVGVESLLRWRHPEHGLLTPDRFIDIAEQSRLIIPIGNWIIETACAQQVAWIGEGLPPLNMSINLSALQFMQQDLNETMQRIIYQTGVQSRHITLEITESTLMETDGDPVEYLNALKDLGVNLAIDDFGTGYSSLAYLKRFPIHHLKIDREFIKEVPHNPHDVALSRSIIKMAHELSLQVVAEGIEDKQQTELLREANCNFGQGYYFGKPMLAEELAAKLRIRETHYSKVSSIHR